MSKASDPTAKQIHDILVKNLEGLHEGNVTTDRANAIARLGNTIFQGVRTRLKVQTQAGQQVSPDLVEYAK